MANITNETSIVSKIWSNPMVYDIRTMFYLVTPNESSYETIDEVPKIVDKVSRALSFFKSSHNMILLPHYSKTGWSILKHEAFILLKIWYDVF